LRTALRDRARLRKQRPSQQQAQWDQVFKRQPLQTSYSSPSISRAP
jgi:hypothetical protein